MATTNYWTARISHEVIARQAKMGLGERTKIYTRQKARAMEHPGIYPEIWH